MLSCRNISRPSSPRSAIARTAAWRRPASSSRVKCRAMALILQCDGRQQTTIVLLAGECGAAITEIALGISGRVFARGEDLSQAQTFEPPRYIAAEVEQVMRRPARCMEESGIVRISADEALVKLRADFVGALRDAGADRGANLARGGAEPCHCRNGFFEHASEGAAPTGMRRADDACLGIGEQ